MICGDNHFPVVPLIGHSVTWSDCLIVIGTTGLFADWGRLTWNY